MSGDLGHHLRGIAHASGRCFAKARLSRLAGELGGKNVYVAIVGVYVDIVGASVQLSSRQGHSNRHDRAKEHGPTPLSAGLQAQEPPEGVSLTYRSRTFVRVPDVDNCMGWLARFTLRPLPIKRSLSRAAASSSPSIVVWA